MKTTGIIAEYNPFHTGHEYQLTYTREKLGADFIIVAMSGDYVQRGAPALLPKHMRAEMALRSGADLVLELPVSIATASAEFFAAGGVSLLDGLGVVDSLCFGSEAGETEPLQELANLLADEPIEYKNKLQEYLRQGVSYPSARSRALSEYSKDEHAAEILSSPNNILGLEYCKAINRLHSTIKPVTLRRQGSGYHDERSAPGDFPSATAIRLMIKERHSENQATRGENHRQYTEPFPVPAPARRLLEKAIATEAYITEEDLNLLLHYCLLSEDLESLCGYMDMTESLARRILKERSRFVDFSQFTGLLKTKDITQTRIQRALMHMLLHIHTTPTEVPYARVLGFRRSSAPLLKEIKAHGRIPLITKIADAPGILDTESMRLLDETTYASNVYQSILSHKTGRGFIHEYEKQVVIV